jgi:NIMA (never in mitosis gene a)-related kinase
MNVSKVIKEKVLLTQTGTPYYASPEVWRDEPYSYKSDLWSIGCVIYELCELHPPFRGKDLDELFEDVCKGEPKRINKLYSNDLWNMIKMLLQVDVEKRVDCNMFLKSKLIENKIEEMKSNPSLYKLKGINLDFNDEGLQKSLLNTIKFSNLNEIKYQLPMTKNYNSMHIPNESKTYKVNSHNVKSPVVKKSPSLNKKSSRNRNSNKKPSSNNNIDINNKDKDENFTLLMKLKEIQMKKESIKNKLVKQIKSKKNREKNRSLNIDNTNDKLKNQSSQRLNVAKNDIRREIKTEQNSDQKIYSSKLIYNKSEIFDKKTNLS